MGALGLAGALTVLLPTGDLLRWLRESAASWGALGPVLFALLFALATVLMLPGSPLGLVAGAAFGLAAGAAAAFVGAVLGATAALLLARGALRPRVRRWLRHHPRLEALDATMGRHGVWVAFLLRLTPAVPFNLLNYALGLTRLSLPGSLLACLALIPGTLLYVGAGAAAGEAVTGAPHGASAAWLLAGGAAAALFLTLWLGRVALRAGRPAPAQGRDGERAASQPSS